MATKILLILSLASVAYVNGKFGGFRGFSLSRLPAPRVYQPPRPVYQPPPKQSLSYFRAADSIRSRPSLNAHETVNSHANPPINDFVKAKGSQASAPIIPKTESKSNPIISKEQQKVSTDNAYAPNNDVRKLNDPPAPQFNSKLTNPFGYADNNPIKSHLKPFPKIDSFKRLPKPGVKNRWIFLYFNLHHTNTGIYPQRRYKENFESDDIEVLKDTIQEIDDCCLPFLQALKVKNDSDPDYESNTNETANFASIEDRYDIDTEQMTKICSLFNASCKIKCEFFLPTCTNISRFVEEMKLGNSNDSLIQSLEQIDSQTNSTENFETGTGKPGVYEQTVATASTVPCKKKKRVLFFKQAESSSAIGLSLMNLNVFMSFFAISILASLSL
ncbi:hypothetical protein Ddc_02451 [Ditylenchus destructor]|nr:hypothetical protein Ddc_02451 [Ditylenchus destructor]